MQWLPGARVARQARARKGQSHGTTGRLFAARARLQIDFSQNLDTKIADLYNVAKMAVRTVIYYEYLGTCTLLSRAL